MTGILNLPDEFLSGMLQYIGKTHTFAAAMTCRTFAHETWRNARNDARRRSGLPFGAAEPAKLYRTPVRAVVNTVELCAWARDTGCWNASVCALAASAGKLEVLQWARQNGCPWDWRTYEWAAGHASIQQWADENGCPWKIVFPGGTVGGHVVRVSIIGTNISLFRHNLSGIPSEIAQLTTLKELDLYGNEISTIPLEITQLINLTVLDLGWNEIGDIPSEIARLTSLNKLNLAGNKITIIPPEIAQLRNLTILRLDWNKIEAIPFGITELKNLRELDLRGNPVRFVPDDIRAQFPDCLTTSASGTQ